MEKPATFTPAPILAMWRVLPGWLRGLIRTMRPNQWTKNLFVFIPILFDRQLGQLDALARVCAAFGLYCLMSSAVYVLNDIVDIERDRLHPKKKHRAIPSGQLPMPIAILAAVSLPIVTLLSALLVSVPLALVLIAYYTKDLAYSFYLKNVVIIDVITVASGFIMRVIAGVVVINVTNFSPWLYVVVGALALFLAVGKRRQELIMLAEAAQDVRATYKDYNLPLLDDMLRMVTNATLISYTFYTFEARTNLTGSLMLLSVPFALYGMFRYLYLIHVKGEGSAPDELLFKDKPLLIAAVLFVLVVGGLIYLPPWLDRIL
ncbi:MAG: decaprenyl-phosphate phosphoribosyltransferase [Aggregatilineales bacterium]